ncbi:outer membrane beta-barrel protein [Alteromonas macleodii]|uniref:outer membrane beta-barrel protein n=1 Tax=Alteromonas macleodii TaxID=28108 RepID=UPI00313FE40C
MTFKKILPLALILTSPFTMAGDFTPPTNYSIHYDSATISTAAGLEADANVFSFGINNYYTNNLSTKFYLGMGAGDSEASVNGVDTRDKVRVNYMASADVRYELPLSNSFSSYVLVGATFIDIKTTEDILNEKRSDFGMKYGVGLSWAVGDYTAFYAEVNQNLYKSDFEVQSFSAGFKFTF